MSRLGTRRRLGCSPMVGRAPTACRQPEAAHASTNSRPTPAIRSMHAYRQQHKQKKIDHTQNGAKTRTARRSAHAALSGPARDAAVRATRGRGRRALAPARLQRSPWPRPRRRCGSAHASAGCPTRTIRLGTPQTPVGTPDTRRAATQWPSADLAPEPPCAPRRQ